jgi:uncharacterized protein (UPF0333 family)
MKIKKRGQVAMEFLLLISIAFMIFLVYIMVTRNKVVDISMEEEYIQLQDFTDSTRNEILVASQVEDGYYREFTLPQKIGDKYEYTIYINQTTDQLLINTTNHQENTEIPHVNGTIQKGTNIITKEERKIYLNYP